MRHQRPKNSTHGKLRLRFISKDEYADSQEVDMSQVHLVDHLEAAKKLAELSDKPFVAYMIQMAKDAALRPETERKRVA